MKINSREPTRTEPNLTGNGRGRGRGRGLYLTLRTLRDTWVSWSLIRISFELCFFFKFEFSFNFKLGQRCHVH